MNVDVYLKYYVFTRTDTTIQYRVNCEIHQMLLIGPHLHRRNQKDVDR